MTHFQMKRPILLMASALLVSCSYNAKLTPEGEKVT
ncbi:DUF4156 domain-containing protein, partial [Legionella pneumophila serogroup 1]